MVRGEDIRVGDRLIWDGRSCEVTDIYGTVDGLRLDLEVRWVNNRRGLLTVGLDAPVRMAPSRSV